MSNYIVLIAIYDKHGDAVRRTQVNVRNVVITDLESAREAIEEGLKRDGFEFTKEERKKYLITMLAKVDEYMTREEIIDEHCCVGKGMRANINRCACGFQWLNGEGYKHLAHINELEKQGIIKK